MRSVVVGFSVAVSLLALGCSGRVTDDTSLDETGTGTGTDTGVNDDGLTPEDLAEIEAVEDELWAIVDGTLAYFAEEQIDYDPPHRCPHPNGGPAGGEAGMTPDLDFNCNLGPEGKCLPTAEGLEGPGIYDHYLWTDNSVWIGVGFEREQGVPHEFHYNLIAINDLNSAYGACEFTASAHADFDGDGLFSTYSISGTIDQQGEIVGELVIVDPYE